MIGCRHSLTAFASLLAAFASVNEATAQLVVQESTWTYRYEGLLGSIARPESFHDSGTIHLFGSDEQTVFRRVEHEVMGGPMKDNAYAWIQGLLLHRQHMGNESNGIQGIAYMDLAGFNVHTRGNAIAQINASGPGSRSEVVFSTLSPITLRVGGNLFADDFDNFVAFEELRETGWTTIVSTQGSRISYSSFLELIRINPGRRYRLISKLNAQSSIFNGTLKISTAGCIVNCYGVNLTGHIGFHQNQVSNSNREVYAAVLRNGSYSEYLYLQTLKDGRFGVSFKRSGHFRFLFQTETSLRRAVELTIGTSEIHGIDISLVEGDLDGSNVIDLGDCQILFRNFGLSREECEWSEMDLDLDGEIGPGDFGIIASNFGMTGDQ